MTKYKSSNKALFVEHDIDFINSIDNIKLSGTLSLPNLDKKHPCVILISGSGAHSRNQVVAGHKIFKDIAYHFSNNGIAVFRFDDRGIGKSEGVFETAGLMNFRNDVISAFQLMEMEPYIDNNKIGVLGHSLGGIIAPMVENQLKNKLAFLISLAGFGMIGRDIYEKQHELIAKARGTDCLELQKLSDDNKKLCDFLLVADDKKEIMAYIKKSFMGNDNGAFFTKFFRTIKKNLDFLYMKEILKIYTHTWFKDFLLCDPKDYWTSVGCPALALNGGKDLQVPALNLDIIKGYVEEGTNNIETKLFPEMNHLFQPAYKGLPEEYATIKTSISTDVLVFMTNWLTNVVNK